MGEYFSATLKIPLWIMNPKRTEIVLCCFFRSRPEAKIEVLFRTLLIVRLRFTSAFIF